MPCCAVLCHAVPPGDRFCGVYHRPTGRVLLYTKGGRGKGASSTEYELSDPQLQGLIEPDLWEQLQEEVELLEVGSSVRQRVSLFGGAVT
jgi:peptide subunit release factor RF-3